MFEWFVGITGLLAFVSAVFGIPYILGWLLYRSVGEQGSSEDRWVSGIFVMTALALITVVPYLLGNLILSVTSGG